MAVLSRGSSENAEHCGRGVVVILTSTRPRKRLAIRSVSLAALTPTPSSQLVVMWQDNSPYRVATPQGNVPPLQFYAAAPYQAPFYPGSRSSLEGNMGIQGSIGPGGVPPSYGGNIQQQGGWWTAFGTGGFEGEPPLLEGAVRAYSYCRLAFIIATELGINFSHIQAKSMTVLNPLQHIDERIMDDADLAGPLLFFFCFGMLLLLVCFTARCRLDAPHIQLVREITVWVHLWLWTTRLDLDIHPP